MSCLLAAGSLRAQKDSVYMGSPDPVHPKKARNDDWKRSFFYGADVSGWLGTETFIFVSPTLGYIPFDNFHIGIGGIYNYVSRDFGQYGKYTRTVFGGHSFARYVIADSYFLQVQYDKLRQPDILATEPAKKIWVDYLLVGGGFRQSIGDNIALTTSVMYNLTPTILSIYPSRIIFQFGFTGGF